MRPQAYPTASPRAPMPSYVWGARWMMAEDHFGDQHPAVWAAIGRQWAALLREGRGAAPNRLDEGPAAKAWTRASGARAGWLNRRARRALRESGLPSWGAYEALYTS
jgi:hypothetical protein